MTLLGGLFERRASVEDPTYPLTSTALVELLDGQPVDAGVKVNETSALGVSAVWRAVSMNASVTSSLPLKTYRQNTRKRAVVRLLENPHPDMTRKELLEGLMVHLQLWGNGYFRKVRNAAGMLTWLIPIPPSAVKVGRVVDWSEMPSPKIYEVNWGDRVEVLTDYEMFHVPGLGYDGITGASPVRIARQSLGVSLASEKYAARLWGSGSLMAGILQTEQRLDDVQAAALKARWKATVGGIAQSHEIAVLGAGAKFQPVQMPNDDAQFLETRRFQVDEVARWFGVPPHMLFELSGSTSWGTGIEQQTIGWVQFSLAPMWLSRIEARLTKELCPAGTYAEFTVDGLLRGDSTARAEFYNKAVGGPYMTGNEARVKENLPPLEGLDDVLAPLNMTPASEDTATNPAAGQTQGETDDDQAA